MKAETHLEVYRPFQGKLRAHPLRFWPLLLSGLQVARKQRRALLILYAPPAIATVIFSFVVYLGFMAQEVIEREMPASGGLEERLMQQAAAAAMAQGTRMLQAVNQIMQFNQFMGMFALLAVAWFGSGLICEDRRAGAHQLYFSRPITRLDYALGKLGTLVFFSLLSMWVPVLVICLVAVFSAPDWSFLREEWDVLPRATLYSLAWTAVMTSLVLAVSSLATRRNFALIGTFGLMGITQIVAATLGENVDSRLHALGLGADMEAIGNWCFDRPMHGPVGGPAAWTAVGVLIALCWVTIAWRLRRMEVVA